MNLQNRITQLLLQQVDNNSAQLFDADMQTYMSFSNHLHALQVYWVRVINAEPNFGYKTELSGAIKEPKNDDAFMEMFNHHILQYLKLNSFTAMGSTGTY